MKLGLSTDFGAPHHWERLVDFATRHEVDRLVFWGNYSVPGATTPCSFSPWPGAVNAEQRAIRQGVRECMADAARRTYRADKEFWYCFQVLMLPPLEQSRQAWPALFNAQGEPDMAHPLVEEILHYQLDEALAIAPHLHGLELWICEGASIILSSLRHQSLTVAQMIERILGIVDDYCREKGLRLTVDEHAEVTGIGNNGALTDSAFFERQHFHYGCFGFRTHQAVGEQNCPTIVVKSCHRPEFRFK